MTTDALATELPRHVFNDRTRTVTIWDEDGTPNVRDYTRTENEAADERAAAAGDRSLGVNPRPDSPTHATARHAYGT